MPTQSNTIRIKESVVNRILETLCLFLLQTYLTQLRVIIKPNILKSR